MAGFPAKETYQQKQQDMSLVEIIPLALTFVNSQTSITDLVPVERITFQRAPQGEVKPYIVIAIGGVEYSSTVSDEIASGSYEIEYHVFADTGQSALTIHNALINRIKTGRNNAYDIRMFDEDYSIDNNGVHHSAITSVWRSNITQCTSK
jgi:hypothetical protein